MCSSDLIDRDGDSARGRRDRVSRHGGEPDIAVRKAESIGVGNARALGSERRELLCRKPVTARSGAGTSRQDKFDARHRRHNQYAKFQAAEAIETAAAQDGGIAGLGAGAAAGMAIGQVMQGALGGVAAPAAAAPAEDPFAIIEKLHKLQVAGAITQAEFDVKKAELLSRVR